MSGLAIERHPSPNFDNRACAISHIILHYTDMADCDAALARLCDAAAKVSAHYLIRRDGHIFQLVDEGARAWHAGVSFWRGETDMNSASIGIELDHDGHKDGAMAASVEENRVMLGELGKRLRRLRQMARRERSANQVLREQVEKDGMVDPSAVNQALKADLDTLTALREAESAETAVILAELRPLVHGMAAEAPEDSAEDVAEGPDAVAADATDETKETGDA